MKRLCALTVIVSLGLALWGCSTSSKQAWRYDVRAFGAVGDGTNNDTVAFQKAFDAAKTAGGGTVMVPPGNYLIGSVVMGSRTTMQLAQGATLIGSADIADYPVQQIRFEGEFVQGHRALISADRADHVAVTGPGAIQGPPLP